MSNITTFNPSNVPAFARNRTQTSSLSKALAGGDMGGGNRISIKGGTFRLISGGKEIAQVEERYLDVVIVNAAPKIGRIYYEGSFDPENPAPPRCWSADGEKPDAKVQDPPAMTCAACPNNIKGSGNGESRACRFSQRLAVVLANDMEGDVMQLTLPATSIFGKEENDNRPLQAYARWLAAQNIGPDMVVTRMKFDTKAESPKLFFKPVSWLTDEQHEICADKGKTSDAIRAITLTVAQTDGVKPIALEGKPPKAKAAAPVDEEVEEPELRKEKEARTPKAKGKGDANAELVAEWDTDD